MDVLLVEDDPQVVNLWRPHLKRAGFAVDAVTTVAAATAAVLQRRYDVVLLDLKLPDGDGLDVLRTMRQHGIETPVMIQSAYGTWEAALNAGHLGAVDFLEKPFVPKTLIGRVLSAAAAAKTTSDPLGRARGELAAVDFGRADAIDLCSGILLRAMADRALTLRQFDRLAAEVRRLRLSPAAGSAEAVSRALDDARDLPCADGPAVTRVLDVISASTTIVASDLARACGMSAETLGILLKRATSQGACHWARIARVRRAVARLVDSADDIGHCAYRAGYPAAGPLDRDCLSHLGISPSRLHTLASG